MIFSTAQPPSPATLQPCLLLWASRIALALGVEIEDPDLTSLALSF